MNGADVPEIGRSGAQRLLWIDIARTIALLSMAIFHFVRDLEFFGVIPPGTTVSGGWAVFARDRGRVPVSLRGQFHRRTWTREKVGKLA